MGISSCSSLLPRTLTRHSWSVWSITSTRTPRPTCLSITTGGSPPTSSSQRPLPCIEFSQTRRFQEERNSERFSNIPLIFDIIYCMFAVSNYFNRNIYYICMHLLVCLSSSALYPDWLRLGIITRQLIMDIISLVWCFRRLQLVSHWGHHHYHHQPVTLQTHSSGFQLASQKYFKCGGSGKKQWCFNSNESPSINIPAVLVMRSETGVLKIEQERSGEGGEDWIIDCYSCLPSLEPEHSLSPLLSQQLQLGHS